MKKIFILTSLLFVSKVFTATVYVENKIVYNGKEYPLIYNLLDIYFKKYPDKKLQKGVIYRSTFEINVGKNDCDPVWKSAIDQLFPNQKNVKADWVSRLQVIPYGKLVTDFHIGYGSTYENYVLFEIQNGNVKKAKIFNYKEFEKFKDKQFLEFKKTEEYKNDVIQMKKNGWKQSSIDSVKRNYILLDTSKILGE